MERCTRRSDGRRGLDERRSSSPGRRGFTLVEMVAVLGILVVQAALLFPAVGRARSVVRGAGCLHHLRQWGLATQLYATDHDDTLPPEGAPNPGEKDTRHGWYVQLPQQLGIPPYHDMPWRTNALANPGNPVWLCPANSRRSNGRNLFHFCLNQWVDGTGANEVPIRLSTLEDPARRVWLFDTKNLPAVGTWSYVPASLHGNGAQFLFLDGHAARVASKEYWDASRGRAHTNSGVLRWTP